MAALTGVTVGDLLPPRQRARWLAVTVGVAGIAHGRAPHLAGHVPQRSLLDLWLPGPGATAWFATGLALSGLGLGAVFPVLSLVVQSRFPSSSMGAADSLRQLFNNLANAVGVPVMGIFLFFGNNLTAAGVERLLVAVTTVAALTALVAFRLPALPLRASFDTVET
jgi:hypothetical protein